MTSIRLRMAVASLLVALSAIAVLSVGVFGLAQGAFERLMVEHGMAIDEARSMFDRSIGEFFLLAVAVAAVTSAALAIGLARWLTAPIVRITAAAQRLARGERDVRVSGDGAQELTSLAESFNQMAYELGEQERMRAEFIANAAHELRTPLTNLVGYLEALRDGVIAPTRDTFMSLREEVDRLVRLAQSLDALAIGDRTGPTIAEDLDLHEAVAMAVELALPGFERRGIRLSIQVPSGVRVRANRDHVAQILANLLQNAVRYTPGAGSVTIRATAKDTEAVVSVANTTEDLPAQDLGHVFERFYRVEKSRDRAQGGAGIGLAIVKQLVELGGGRVGVESAQGLTRFWFTVPVRS